MDEKRRKRHGKRRQKKRTSSFRQNRTNVIMICSVLCMLAGVLGVHSVRLYAKNADYRHQEELLQTQIEEQEERAEKVKAYEEYVKTDEYIKDVAEEKLDLVDPNEIIFKPSR